MGVLSELGAEIRLFGSELGPGGGVRRGSGPEG